MIGNFSYLQRKPGWGERVQGAVLGAPLHIQAPEPSRLILWTPVVFAAGSASYFALPFEPPAQAGIPFAGMIALLASLMLTGFRGVVRLYLLVLGLSVSAGFWAAQDRTLALAPPDLSAFEAGRVAQVEGWIERVERLNSRARLVIRVTRLEHAPDPPKRVRVRAGLGVFSPGDPVRLIARLSPPGAPVAAGGYDPARALWFDEIALTGFALGELQSGPAPATHHLHRGLARLRWRLAQDIQAAMSKQTGAIAAALLTGERAAVSRADAEALRGSGLGHILAISGLHMGLFAGGVYWFACRVIASIELYARAHDPRIPAAFIALCAATGYLVLSGAAVSTQRAYVMAVVVLIGVILRRRAFSMRSLALAAIVVLILAPESIIEPGFQMSFSAVAALIASYDIWTRYRVGPSGPRTLLERAWFAFVGLGMTSVIAGAATGAFAVFHFQRVAAYGLIGNLMAMPVFTFWVMPAGGAGLAASVLGLEAPFLWFMDQGLRVILLIAHKTAELKGAGVGMIAAPPALVALYGGGFALMALGLGLVRVGGLVLVLSALAFFSGLQPPHMMISDTGVVLARFEGAGDSYAVTDRRRGRFDSAVFLQRAGLSNTPKKAQLHCDALGCVGMTRESLRLAVTERAEALEEDCARVDIIVFHGEASAWRRRRCAAVLLDNAARRTLGGAELWVENGQVIRVRAAQDGRRSRIWASRAL